LHKRERGECHATLFFGLPCERSGREERAQARLARADRAPLAGVAAVRG
jgi:hypothetical protein